MHILRNYRIPAKIVRIILIHKVVKCTVQVRHKIKGLVLDSNGRKTRLCRSKCQYVIVNFRLVTVWVKKTISNTGNEGLNLRYIHSESKKL